MNKLYASIGTVLTAILVLCVNAQAVNQESENTPIVVGTFDSRAVAVAYVRSEKFNERIISIQARLRKAEAAGDEKAAAELRAKGPSIQEQAHNQAFGTASVEGILDLMRKRLPDIAKQAGVELIVSKWMITYADPNATTVDVTDSMTAFFKPNEETKQVIAELLATKPLTEEQLVAKAKK